MPDDFEIRTHREWLGYVQPVGVVVSATALAEAGVAINQNLLPLHRELVGLLEKTKPWRFADLAVQILGWRPEDLATPDASFRTMVAGYEDVMHPTYIVRDGNTTLLLVQELTVERRVEDLDREIQTEANRWKGSPQMRFERLLRETDVPAGLLVCAGAIRLVYAPKGESSGHITFVVKDMEQVAGRPILGALHMLLSAERLWTGPQNSGFRRFSRPVASIRTRFLRSLQPRSWKPCLNCCAAFSRFWVTNPIWKRYRSTRGC